MAEWTVDQVNARSLRAHGLEAPVDSIAQAIVAAAGIYGTAPTSHLGLAARLDAYAPAELERQRLETRAILRVPGPRGSIFLAPRGLVPAFLGLSRPATARRVLQNDGMSQAEQRRLSDRVEAVLADGSLSARGVRERLGADDPGGPRTTLLLRTMVSEGRVVAAEPVGGERATAFRYARMAEWAPAMPPPLSPEDALAIMAPLWMRANGPGTVGDLAWWAGVTKSMAREALAAMGARVVGVEGLEGEQWATEEVIEGLESAQPGGTVQLLPAWDAWLMARPERARILDPTSRPFVVDRSGNVTNTVTLDGRVVGTWDVDGQTLLVHRFETLDDRRLRAAADRLRAVRDWTELRAVPAAVPLDDGGQNAFRAPLRSR